MNSFRQEIDPALLGRIVRREMRLMVLYPLIPLLGFSQSTCENGSPTWLWAIYLPFLIRVKILEWRILRRLGESNWDIFTNIGFVFGILDALDWFTDGAFPIQAVKCDRFATVPFQFAFHESMSWFLVPLVGTLRFYGLAYMLLSAAAFSQFATGIPFANHEVPFAIAKASAADVAGMGALAGYIEKYIVPNGNGKGFSKILLVITKVLVENCLQLSLQVSFFALTMDMTNESAQAKMLVSIFLGIVCAVYKWAMGMHAIWVFYNDTGAVLFVVAGLVLNMITPCVIAWVAAKLYFVYACDSHLWNITSGCVSFKT